MGRLFFFILFAVLAILFFPIYLETDTHYDMNRKKLAFAVYAYKKIPIIGGYVSNYKEGIAFHVSKSKAILVPYRQMGSERKKFSFFQTCRLKGARLTTEIGAEYLFLSAIAHLVLRIFFFCKGGERDKIKNNVWITDGDVLRVSLNLMFYFNLYILMKSFMKFCKEKLYNYVRQK